MEHLSPRLRRWLAALVLAVAACNSAGDPAPTTTLPGEATPEQAVGRLLEALAAEDWDTAARLTLAEQMALVALAEGVTVEEAAVLLDDGATLVAANFWSSFAESLSQVSAVGLDQLEVGEAQPLEVPGASVVRVEVVAPGGESRWLVVREAEGWQIDAIASFSHALVSKLVEAAELAANAKGDGGAKVLEAMRRQEPSVRAVLAFPDLTPQLEQATRRLLAALG